MIIFDLDGTLADCEHRRHFVDPKKHPDYFIDSRFSMDSKGKPCNQIGEPFVADWKSFYEACDQDKMITNVIDMYHYLLMCGKEIEIWSGRCESVRSKTEYWINNYVQPYLWNSNKLKMRPIGDNTPDDQLKEKWLDELIAQGKTIDFVFDDRPKVVRMWKRRGIFVFNCKQSDGEF